ncbi:MAG: HEAT repeat domain-containing protein [Planctomycetes bacterium]|nr:HEAT repeat domain-containing protein [Planctomycetota bacterium]
MRAPHRALAPGLAAAGAEGIAAALCFGAHSAAGLLAALLVHLLAARLAAVAAARRPGCRTVDVDLVALIAIAAPPCGAVFGWLLPPGPAGRGRDAHEAFEAGETGRTAPRIDWTARAAAAAVADDALPLSFDEILRHGSIEHRRNALRRLATLGEPRHLRLLRRALGHDDPELRLAAFAELDRAGRVYEHALDAARELVRRCEIDRDEVRLAQARTALAERHRAFADSGLLDPSMGRYHRDQADRLAECAVGDDTAALLARARVAVDRGDPLEALRLLPEDGDLVVQLARAEALWTAHRFDALADLVDLIAQRWPYDIPDWLRDFRSVRRGSEDVG